MLVIEYNFKFEFIHIERRRLDIKPATIMLIDVCYLCTLHVTFTWWQPTTERMFNEFP